VIHHQDKLTLRFYFNGVSPYQSRYDDYITYLKTNDFHRDININTKRKRFVDLMVAFSVDSSFLYYQAPRDVKLKVLNYKICGPVKVYRAASFVQGIQKYRIDEIILLCNNSDLDLCGAVKTDCQQGLLLSETQVQLNYKQHASTSHMLNNTHGTHTTPYLQQTHFQCCR